MSTFEHLFQPLAIRGVTIRNRILSTGHQTFLARDAAVSDELVAYHEARARGGVGLIVTEAARFHDSALTETPEIRVLDDGAIAGYRRLADAVHRHGAKIIGQLSHAGRCSQRRMDGARGVVYAPSAVPDNRFHTMPRAMPTAMVEEIIEACGAGARRLAEAGLDGVELMVSHGLLFAQFVNPATNLRTDRFGGSFENRLRPLVDSLKLARDAFGPDRVVGIRISVEENEQDGMDTGLSLEVARHLSDEGLIDYVNTTTGSMAGLGGSIHVVPPMEIEHGYVAPKAKVIRDAVGVPVFVAGRINQPQIAEGILKAGQADMCGMTRALIADEAMAAKAEAGDLDAIRACIGCNQGCIGHFHQGVSITCIQNPVSGRETRMRQPAPADARRTVLVAGGGPAGMKAAVTAAERGHRVILCEAGARLGGQAGLAALLPDRAEFGGLISNLETQLERYGAEIRRNTHVTASLVSEIAPEAVIVATGSTAYRPAIEGAEDAHVVDAHQVLTGQVNPGGRVLVADWRCDWVGIGIAEKMALEGRHVRLAVNGTQAGQELQPYQRDHLIGKLHRAGVEVIPYSRLFGVDADTAYLLHIVTGDPVICEEVETVILAYGAMSDTRLEDELSGIDVPLHFAGDCLCPRTAEEAVLEGMRAGLAV